MRKSAPRFSTKTWNITPTLREREDKELAGHFASEQFPVVPDYWTLNDVDEYISQNGSLFDAIDYVYVVNEKNKLVGVISIKDLFRYPLSTSVKKIMKRDIITVSPDAHKEKIARLTLEHNLRAIPIVKNGQLEGVILTHKILHILNQALHEHIISFSGVHRSHLEYENTMRVPLLESILHRAPWLIIGFFGVIVAAGIIDQFEYILDEHIVFAFFIPAILYMSNALGTQNQTLLIRDLALMGKELPIGKYFVKTILISAIVSLIISTLVYGATSIIWNENTAGGVIALAMFITLMISSASSLATTIIFKKMKQDPALGSGPFATIISDVSSILIYFLIVSTLL